jgi:hypothetical protein
MRLLILLRSVGALSVALAGLAPSHAAEPAGGHAMPTLELPRAGLTADDVAVVINDADPYSVEVGALYAAARPAGKRRWITRSRGLSHIASTACR